jgi:addiction module HigA family antidote
MSITIEEHTMNNTSEIPCDGVMHHPPHPGESLKLLYMEPLDLTIKAVAERLGVERKTISRLIHGHTGVTAEMAIRLGKAFGTTPDLWLNKQRGYDLWNARQRMSETVESIQPFLYVGNTPTPLHLG